MRKVKFKKRVLATILSVVCLMAMNLSVLAAEPVPDNESLVFEVAEETSTESTTVDNGISVARSTTSVRSISDTGSAIIDNGISAAISTASTRSIYGYAADYTASSIDSFYVNATGSSSGTGGFTVESYSFSSSTVKIAITLYRPDGTQALTTTLTGNQKIENLSFSNAMSGNYRVDYHVYGASKGWIGAWVY